MLARWNPFTQSTQSGWALRPFTSEFDNLFRDIGFAELFRDAGWTGQTASTKVPPADVVETENEIQVMVDLPGHSPKDIEVKLEGDTLTIHAERKQEKQVKGENYLRTERSFGSFSRSFVLPSVIDGSKPEARYVNGVLTVTLPKSPTARPRVIEVKD